MGVIAASNNHENGLPTGVSLKYGGLSAPYKRGLQSASAYLPSTDAKSVWAVAKSARVEALLLPRKLKPGPAHSTHHVGAGEQRRR